MTIHTRRLFAPIRPIVAALLLLACFSSLAAANSAPPGEKEPPNPQQRRYYFEHRLLPKWTFHSNGAFFSDLRNGHALHMTKAATDIVGESYAAAIKVTPLADENRVLLSFAEPEDIAACFHVLIVRTDHDFRFLTLELAEDILGNGAKSVLGGWSAEGGHSNFGQRKYSDSESFVHDEAVLTPEQPEATM